MNTLRRHWRLAVIVVLGIAIAIYFATGADLPFMNPSRENMAQLIDRAGIWGPVLIVALMVLAVVASPIPSAPVALAAGAAYGHLQGTILVLIGSEAGALIAFGLARYLGRETIQRLLGTRLDRGLLGSQNALMLTVFTSRLMPFISFDMVSYGAGLSVLSFWRFAVATMAGIIPASFVLAHLGGQAVDDPFGVASIAVLGLGLITGIPILLMMFGWRDRPVSGATPEAIDNDPGLTGQTEGKTDG